MTSTTVAKQNPPRPVPQIRERSAGNITNPNPTPTGSNRSDTSFKRWQARGSLSTQLKDRTTQGPVKWTRSLTDVSISDYKSRCREYGERHLYARRGNLHGGSTRKDNKPNDGNASVEEFIYSSGATFAKGRPSIDVIPETEEAPKEYIRHVTIAELHKILETSKQKQRVGGDDMKIVIDSVPNAYPNIKLTFKDSDLFQDQQKGVKLPAVGPVMPSGHGQKNGQSSQLRKPSMVDSSRGRVNELPLTTKACLAVMDRSQVSSAERTKKWIHQSPLGASVNEEYDQEPEEPMKIRSIHSDARFKSSVSTDSHAQPDNSVTNRKSVKSATTQVSAASKNNRKVVRPPEPDKSRKQARKVRFGTDKFLLTDPQRKHDIFTSR